MPRGAAIDLPFLAFRGTWDDDACTSPHPALDGEPLVSVLARCGLSQCIGGRALSQSPVPVPVPCPRNHMGDTDGRHLLVVASVRRRAHHQSPPHAIVLCPPALVHLSNLPSHTLPSPPPRASRRPLHCVALRGGETFLPCIWNLAAKLVDGFQANLPTNSPPPSPPNDARRDERPLISCFIFLLLRHPPPLRHPSRTRPFSPSLFLPSFMRIELQRQARCCDCAVIASPPNSHPNTRSV